MARDDPRNDRPTVGGPAVPADSGFRQLFGIGAATVAACAVMAVVVSAPPVVRLLLVVAAGLTLPGFWIVAAKPVDRLTLVSWTICTSVGLVIATDALLDAVGLDRPQLVGLLLLASGLGGLIFRLQQSDTGMWTAGGSA